MYVVGVLSDFAEIQAIKEMFSMVCFWELSHFVSSDCEPTCKHRKRMGATSDDVPLQCFRNANDIGPYIIQRCCVSSEVDLV